MARKSAVERKAARMRRNGERMRDAQPPPPPRRYPVESGGQVVFDPMAQFDPVAQTGGVPSPHDSCDRPVVDVGGRQAQVEVLMDLLYEQSKQRKRLESVMIANGQQPGDPVVGQPPLRADGTVNSYKLALAELDAATGRLAQAFPAEMEMVRAMIEKRDAA